MSRSIAARRRLRSVPAGRDAATRDTVAYVVDEGRIRSLDVCGVARRSLQ
jgi:hypothetical protein